MSSHLDCHNTLRVRSKHHTRTQPPRGHQTRVPTYEQRVSAHGKDGADDEKRAVCYGSKLGQCQSRDDDKQGVWMESIHDTRGVCCHPCLGLANVREVMAAVTGARAGCATCG